jgi:hypothetical protein
MRFKAGRKLVCSSFIIGEPVSSGVRHTTKKAGTKPDCLSDMYIILYRVACQMRFKAGRKLVCSSFIISEPVSSGVIHTTKEAGTKPDCSSDMYTIVYPAACQMPCKAGKKLVFPVLLSVNHL